MTTKPKTLRCAIYTRKSSEDGLDQAYNSLDAQRDACAAYVASQAGEGWVLASGVYDDGGFSGGNLERPALKRLLADIEAKRVDVIVVYKVDRLTRALSDFAKIVEVLDRHEASFVSVTQAFNTTTSMGRLTLNVLLSFAQFEREVTGERIRDKIAASKKLGMWMGGSPPLGYRPAGRTLQIEPDEAGLVRHIFERYLALGSVHHLAAELASQGKVSKAWTSVSGHAHGGRLMQRGALFHLLRNRTYIGEIPHKGASYPGRHPAIIDQALFEAVQRKLDETATVLRPGRPAPPAPRAHKGAPLAGLVFDASGVRLSPVSARRKGGAAYRYYVSRTLQSGGHTHDDHGVRIPAGPLEALVADRLHRLGLLSAAEGTVDWTEARRWIANITVGPSTTTLSLSPDTLSRLGNGDWMRGRLDPSDQITLDDNQAQILLSISFVRRAGAVMAVYAHGGDAISRPRLDAPLASALIRAESWKRRLYAGEVASIQDLAEFEAVTPAYATRLMRVAFLAPDLKHAILEGRQSSRLTLQAITKQDLPMSWKAQQGLFHHR